MAEACSAPKAMLRLSSSLLRAIHASLPLGQNVLQINSLLTLAELAGAVVATARVVGRTGGIGQLCSAVLNQLTIVHCRRYSYRRWWRKVGMTKRLDLSRFELEHKPPASVRVPQTSTTC
jgi:hypothetical protein